VMGHGGFGFAAVSYEELIRWSVDLPSPRIRELPRNFLRTQCNDGKQGVASRFAKEATMDACFGGCKWFQTLQRETHLMCETALMGRKQVLTSF